jgi:signal transduction histidine kinase
VTVARSLAQARAVLRPALPLVAAGLLIGWLVVDAGDRARSHADASLRTSVAAAITPLSSALREQVTKAPLSVDSRVATVPADAEATAPVSLSSLVEARDSGKPVLDDRGGHPSIVVPVYGTGPMPPTTAARRQSVSAYRVVPLDLAAAIRAVLPDSGGLVVRGPNTVVLADPRPAPKRARTFEVPLDVGGTDEWVLQGWLPSPALAGQTWMLALLLLAGFGGLSALLAADERHAARARERERQLTRDGELVSGLAPVVQASLDLGEVIPAASAHLAQGLGLAGLSLSAPGSAGERQLFAWGAPPDAGVTPSPTPPLFLAPGSTFALSLARGGRVLGVLRVVAGERLAATELRALATASELLGSTLANAEAFAQQQMVVERMQSVDELKTVFLATASHELRTPVAAIVGFSQLVLDQWGKDDPERSRAFLERVLANARSLESLTEQLLDFSRLERGLRPAMGELLDLGKTASRVLQEQPELTAAHNLSLRVAPDCLVLGSAPAVARIVTNLVGNAAKYSPAGTTITVTVRSDGEQVSLTVDDEGPGVPVADRERIFTRFYRGHGDQVTGTRGTGVGLAIVAEFAASMSGTATVQEAPSRGARFCVSFPAAGVLTHVHDERDDHVRLA